MIKVLQIEQEDYLVLENFISSTQWYTGSIESQVVKTPDPLSYTSFDLWIPYRSHTTNFGLKPKAGPRSELGNRTCVHHNFSGHMSPKVTQRRSVPLKCWYQRTREDVEVMITSPSNVLSVNDGKSLHFEGFQGSIPITAYIPTDWSGELPFIEYRELCILSSYLEGEYLYFSLRDIDHNIPPSKTLKDRSTTYRFKIEGDKWYDLQYLSEGKWEVPFKPNLKVRRVLSLSLPDVDPDTELRRLSYELDQLVPAPNYRLYGDLVPGVVDNCKVLANHTLIYLSKLVKIPGLVAQTVSSLSTLAEGDFTALADLYLQYRYAYKLSYEQTIDIVTTSQKNVTSISHDVMSLLGLVIEGAVSGFSRSRYTLPIERMSYPLLGEATRSRSLELYYKPQNGWLSNLHRNLSNYGLFPDLATLWDAIPYSFVVDWFTSLSASLEYVDDQSYIHELKQLETVFSSRVQIRNVSLEYRFNSDLSCVLYHRGIESKLPPQNPTLTVTPSKLFNHAAEGTSLFIQHIR